MLDHMAARLRWLLGSRDSREVEPASRHLWARWIFLRALGFIYFSAFYSFYFQIKGLVGPDGILPARDYLLAVNAALQLVRFWYAPTVFWLGTSDHALMITCWIGLIASLLVFLNLWPRASLFICFVCFLSFIAIAQDFASYQSDGMLLEAGLISLFFAPPGLRPGLGFANGPSRASLFLLQWEWFRIYFQSGVVKLASGDQSWRNLTAMDDYYQNGPLPSWMGWYVQHLAHGFHASVTVLVLVTELLLTWMLFLPRRFRIICFCIVTPMQVSIILTGNYAFLNYIVLFLGFLLLDDGVFERWTPSWMRNWASSPSATPVAAEANAAPSWHARITEWFSIAGMLFSGLFLGWLFYASSVQMLWMFFPGLHLPSQPIRYLEPFRVADSYGLFAVMTHERYEIEFQGSNDGGKTWTPFPFRYKPQDPAKAPGIYAPYQPRFEWNLWFASLGSWRQYRFVVWTEERLLTQDPDVLELFAYDPFGGNPPQRVRAVVYQYWFTDYKTKHETGMWWRRELLGDYAPELEREPDGKIVLVESPDDSEGQP